jgi:hypothetical protein
MTMAAGFVARDGVLLCTDSLYSGGVRVYGRKIFTHPLEAGVISFALAGHEPFAKRAIEDSKDDLDRNPNAHGSLVSIKARVESVLKTTWENFVDARPIEEREGSRFQLLIAIGTRREGTHLFSAVGPVLTPIETYECFGVGFYVGHHIIETAYRPRMPLEKIAIIAVHALGIAKWHVEGVGGPSQFEVIRDADVTDTLSRY